MAVAQGTIRVHEQGQAVTFRVEGRATMTQSLPFRRFAEQRLAAGATLLRVDLRACTYMDSTFLGTLLFLRRAVSSRGQGELVLVLPSPVCRQLLHQTGLDEVLAVTEEAPEVTSSWADLAGGPADADEFRRGVVQAHEELAGLEGPAGEPFRAVMRCLGKNAEAGKS